MSWRLLPARDHFPAWRETWDRLNAALYQAHPLFDSRFFGPLLQAFGDEVQLALWQPEGEVRGMLLLAPRSSRVWGLFLPSQAQITPMLLRPEDYPATARLFSALPGHPFLLDWLCQDPDYSLNISEDGEHQYHRHAHTMQVRIDGDFARYWAARGKSLRHNLGRYRRRILQSHRLDVRILETPETLLEGLSRYCALESRGWKAGAGTAIGLDNAQGRFYQSMLASFAEAGQARVYELYLDTILVASRLAIDNGRMLIMLKTTYDETYAEFAPGRVLLHDVLEHEFAVGRFQLVEFYTNASRDQLYWATGSRDIVHVSRYASPLHRRGLDLARKLRRWLNGAEAKSKQGMRHAVVESET